MGQSQILLLVLALVILGLALATALDLFKTKRRQAELDRVTLDMSTITQKIQVWKMQPAELDGGAKKDLADIEFGRIYHATGPCDDMAGPLGVGQTCYFQEQEIRYILQPEDTDVRLIALSRGVGREENDFRIAEALVTGIHPEDVEFELVW